MELEELIEPDWLDAEPCCPPEDAPEPGDRDDGPAWVDPYEL